MSGAIRRLRQETKRNPPKSADGVVIIEGMKMWEVETRDSGRTWSVRGPFEVVKLGSPHAWLFKGQQFYHTSMGDNRSFASRLKAERSAKERTERAAKLKYP